MRVADPLRSMLRRNGQANGVPEGPPMTRMLFRLYREPPRMAGFRCGCGLKVAR